MISSILLSATRGGQASSVQKETSRGLWKFSKEKGKQKSSSKRKEKAKEVETNHRSASTRDLDSDSLSSDSSNNDELPPEYVLQKPSALNHSTLQTLRTYGFAVIDYEHRIELNTSWDFSAAEAKLRELFPRLFEWLDDQPSEANPDPDDTNNLFLSPFRLCVKDGKGVFIANGVVFPTGFGKDARMRGTPLAIHLGPTRWMYWKWIRFAWVGIQPRLRTRCFNSALSKGTMPCYSVLDESIYNLSANMEKEQARFPTITKGQGEAGATKKGIQIS
ncbi:hypothetical protein L208DRAFT_1382974 [Tricholoma matsutake]|nr:hypothetical protein L208DRAFT_1382974 [Tricholoma matsutake 945]